MNKAVGRMNGGIPQVPHATVNQELLPVRQALPIWPMRDDIISLINSNQVVLICGDTGSGKTTQVKCCQIKAVLILGFSCNVSFHQNFPPVWIFFSPVLMPCSSGRDFPVFWRKTLPPSSEVEMMRMLGRWIVQ